jgi:hypothetical protein
LELFAGPSLEANSRLRCRYELLAKRADGPLHSSERDLDAVLLSELLSDDRCVSAVSKEALPEPVIETVESALAERLLVGCPPALA